MPICLKEDKTQIDRFNQILDIAGTLDTNSKIVFSNENNLETVEWLYKKATRGTPLSFDTIPIQEVDVKRFKRTVKEFIDDYGKQAGFFGRFFKLPKVLVKNIKGGQDFYNHLAEAMSFNQRQRKESAQHIMSMTDGLYKMFTESFGEKEYKKFAQLERNLMAANTVEQKTEMIRQLHEIAGSTDNKGTPLGGKILRRYQKLLDFTQQPETQNERMIVKEWNIMRANSMNNLLNGAIMAKMAIRSLNDPQNAAYLTRAIDKIEERIQGLLLQSERDSILLETLKPGEADADGNLKSEIRVYNPKTKSYAPYRKFDPKTGDYDYVGIQGKGKYFPKYVIELTDIIDNVTEYALNPDKSPFLNKTSAEILAEVEKGVATELNTTRLEHAGETEKWHSLDPIYYLNKYAHDVSSFNARARVQYAYIEATKNLREVIAKNEQYAGMDGGDYAQYMLSMLTEIRDSAINHHKGSMDSMDHIVQIINAFEYVAKLGWSVRGGLKNRTQALYNWVFFGLKGYRRSNDFYDRNSREYDPRGKGPSLRTNPELLERQLKRFGYKMGDKYAVTSAATGGSLDFVYIPKGFITDAQGKLIPEPKTGALKRGAMLAQVATEWAAAGKLPIVGELPIGMAWAENKNRISTFKIAFANAFMVEQNRYDYHAKRLKEKTGREPLKDDVYNAIEHAAGNVANDMVRTLHYDYDNWAKARILRSKGGRVIGQYQHFKFAFFDMQYNLIRDFAKDVKDFNFKEIDPISGETVVSESFSRAFRLASLYTLIPGMAAFAFNSDLGGIFGAFGSPFEEDVAKEGRQTSGVALIENPVIEDAGKLYNYISGLKEGDSLQRYSAYYGKNPITAQLGPFISDLLMAAELFDFYNQTDDEYSAHRSLNYDPSDTKWWYNVARIFQIQGARTAWHTIPSLLKGQMEKAIRIETGVFQPRWMKNWREGKMKAFADATYNKTSILPDVEWKSKGASSSEEYKEQQRRAALYSLREF
tara:strand:+ start:13602 stop:16565 length:2964 start_codon:yes stop_codon:yes gene_type:complete